jgi:hypothetical protein
MRIWIALIVAPLLALADQAIAFAIVGWGCAHQDSIALQACHLLFLAGAVAAMVAAWRSWRESSAGAERDEAVAAQRRFLAGVATAVAMLSAAAIAAMWLAVGMIASCIA